MDRKKPSLTSPWKVGFLVALLLVVTSLGVSYFITGTFGVTWHWIHIGGLHPSTWTFNTGAFLEEMAPLLLLTALLAFAAYVLVAGAVRRYKAYVDSGVEYKQLLKSIKTMDDLDDADMLERLKQHPEIREFLMGIKRRLGNGDSHNGDRERKPSQASPALREERPRLPSESALLASAIASGSDAFSRELALTVPELKQIERALREHFAHGTDRPAPAAAAAASVDSRELDALRSSVLDEARSIRRDVEDCAGGAHELEVALIRLGAVIEGGAPVQAPAHDTTTVQSRIDATAEALAALGEETRRIAIASAMQASGGPASDVIKVADELRSLATKFNTVAQHWRDTAPALKQLLAGGGQDAQPATSVISAAAATAVSRVRLWSERLAALNERVRALETTVHKDDVATDPASDRETSPVFAADRAEGLAAAPVLAPAAEPVFTSNADEDFVTRGNRDMFATDDDTTTPFADIPFEKEHRFFADTPATDTGDDRFVVDRADEGRWDLSGSDDAPTAPDASTEPSAPVDPAAPAAENGHDTDGFLTGPRPVVSPRKIERAPARDIPVAAAPAPQAPSVRTPAPEPEPVFATATATLDPDADATDLYELGAVDCVQTV